MASETIEDIVQSMRGYAAAMDERFKEAVEGDKRLSCNTIAFRMRVFADRIEAAYKREVVVAKMETTTKENLVVGNNAKLREALKDVAEQIQDEAKWADEMSYQQAIALGIIQSALAAPPRNCDLYDSEEDAWDAYLQLHPNAECPNDEYEMWLFDPVEAKCGVALNTKSPENVNSEKVVYNNAKMREALKRIVSVCADAEITDCQAREIAEDVAGAALAAPPRNCDRYPTFAAALDAWREADPRDAGTFDEWLFAEAEGETDGNE